MQWASRVQKQWEYIPLHKFLQDNIVPLHNRFLRDKKHINNRMSFPLQLDAYLSFEANWDQELKLHQKDYEV